MTEQTTEWCMSLPLVSRRELKAEERQGLERHMARLRWCGIGVVLLHPVLVGLFGLGVWTTSVSVQETQAALAGSAIILLVVFLPLQLLVVRDVLQRRKALSSDLQVGVKRFEGVVKPGFETEGAASKLRRPPYAPNKITGQWSIEILAASGRVWRAQDQAVKPWIIVPIVTVAQTPEMAAIAAQWLQPVLHNDSQTLLRGQREMSDGERGELRGYARRVWRRPLPPAIGLTLWVGLPLALSISQRKPPRPGNEGVFNILICLAVLADAHLAVSIRLSRRMRQDADAGRVVIVRVEAAAQGNVQENATGGEAESVEVLPNAKREWTRGGQPAAWRLTPP